MTEHLTITIDLDLTDPVAGTVRSDQEPIRFSGWVELHAALEAICTPNHGQQPESGSRSHRREVAR